MLVVGGALPGVPMPSSLSVAGDFDATLTVQGTRVSAVILASPTETVGFVVRSGKLYVSSIGWGAVGYSFLNLTGQRRSISSGPRG